MKHLFNLSFLLLFTACATSIPEIKATNNDITVDDFRSHIGYLASDGLKGRSSGSEGD